MKFPPILLVVLMIASSCSTMFVGSKHTEFGSTVEVIENQASVSIEYKSYEHLYDELLARSSVQMWTDEKLQSEASYLPSGGYLMVHVSGSTIASANTKWWEYIVQTMEGEEIYRQQGRDDIPEYTTSQYGTTWWNIDCISPKIDGQGPFRVYVVDMLFNKRSGFIVYPNQAN